MRVTHGGGFQALESPDGKWLYYVESNEKGKLWRMPAQGGEAGAVLDDVLEGRWAVTRAGVYFLDSLRQVCRLEESGGRVCLGKLTREGPETGGIGVSRDGSRIVFTQPEPVESELRMAEGRLFR